MIDSNHERLRHGPLFAVLITGLFIVLSVVVIALFLWATWGNYFAAVRAVSRHMTRYLHGLKQPTFIAPIGINNRYVLWVRGGE